MIIAFGHQRRRGKDTCAKFLETALKMQNSRVIIQKHSFADSLKNACTMLYGWAGLKSAVYYENHPEEREIILPDLGKSPRDIWIDFGNGVREAVHKDTFAAKVVKACLPKTINIISDLRYPNEAEWIKKTGGICIKVTRKDMTIPTDVADTALNDWTGWDKIIENDETLVELSEKIGLLAKELYGKF